MCACGEGIITGDAAHGKAAVERRGLSWDCPRCAKIKARRLRARALAAQCNCGFDLTIRHLPHRTIEEETALLKKCWRDFRLWWNRHHPNAKISAITFWEVKGERHVHIHALARAPFIPKKILKGFFFRRIGSYKQVIKDLRNTPARIYYASKYVTKDLKKLPGTHRYSATHDFDDLAEPFAPDPFFQDMTWDRDTSTLCEFAQRWLLQGWRVDLSVDRGVCTVRPP